jgi:predicted amidohydrolase YtcJ
MTTLQPPSAAQADLVLRGGSIWPGLGRPRAQALAARAGRVIAIGRDPDVHDLIGPHTRVVDLRGRFVVPGFNDAHVHFLEGGHGLLSVDLRTAADEADLARRLEEHARTLPTGAWIRQGNWDHQRWPGGRLPSRASIDAATPDHPVFVNRLDGHLALCNSLALRQAGIDRRTQDPLGGRIERDATGEPTGIVMDNAMDLVRRAIPEPSRELNRRAARAALGEAARLGVTTIQDDSAIDALPTYLELRDRGELTARLSVWRPIRALPSLIASGMRPGLGDDWVRLGPLKILSDGSLGAATAAMHEPYVGEPDNRGLLLYEVQELEDLIQRADAAGFALAVHAIGDRANQVVLDAFEKAVQRNGGGPRPFRIEHAQIVTRADVARYRALGVIASIQPSHAIDDLRFAEAKLGPARCADAYNVRSFLDAGVDVAFGTDWYVEPLDPRLGLYAAVTRERPEGGPDGGWLPQEKIGLEQALDLYTRGSARAERTERDKGTLLPGRLADCVVFAADLSALPPRDLLQVPVDATIVGGRVVFERG